MSNKVIQITGAPDNVFFQHYDKIGRVLGLALDDKGNVSCIVTFGGLPEVIDLEAVAKEQFKCLMEDKQDRGPFVFGVSDDEYN